MNRFGPIAVLGLAACAEAPWLSETGAPADSDLVIASAIDSIERLAPVTVQVPWPEVMFLDQEHVLDSEGGFTHVNRLLGQECSLFIIVRERYADSIAHELVHCAIVATQCSLRPDTDPGHQRAAWWAILPAVRADIASALGTAP